MLAALLGDGSDIIALDKAGTLAQRSTMFNFLCDLTHALKLRGEDRGRVRSSGFDIQMPELPKGPSFFDQQQTS